jgi:hypothetical protein
LLVIQVFKLWNYAEKGIQLFNNKYLWSILAQRRILLQNINSFD